MLKPIITFLAIIFCVNAMAQSPITKKADCELLKNLHFKNGVDTVVVKAVYDDMTERAQGGPWMKTLIKEKKIRKDNFSSQIILRPVNCSEVFYAPTNANSRILNTAKLGIILNFTCVFFERREWEHKGVPFFVVIKASKVK